jgi:DNA-binding MarR family transcriptional regulator
VSGRPRQAPPLAISVWLRLLRTHGIILREIRRSMAEQGTTLPRFDVLAQLQRAPGGLTPRELAGRLLVTAGNLTVIIRQLEKEGLVRRSAVREDRRSYRLALTAEGRRRVARLIPRHRRDLERILSSVPAGTLAQLKLLLGETLDRLGGHGRDGASPDGPFAEMIERVREMTTMEQEGDDRAERTT